MRASRAHDDTSDGSAAARTRQAGAAVDVEEMLHVAGTGRRAIRIDRRAAPRNSFAQHGAHCFVKLALLGSVQAGAATQRMQSRAPQRLVGVDIAHAGDETLVHEQALEPALAPSDTRPEISERERVI